MQGDDQQRPCLWKCKVRFLQSCTGEFGRYAEDYVKSLGKKTVIRLYNEQVSDFSEAVVKHGVYTDGEGCSYNACIWKDEQ